MVLRFDRGWPFPVSMLTLVHIRKAAGIRQLCCIQANCVDRGVNYYLSCWYKRSELGLRAAIFFSAAAIAGSFGGLLAAAIALMDGIGGRPGWAWIFIIEGLATCFVGCFCWWMVFDWPDTARFLSPEERIRVRRRLAEDNQSSTSEDYDKRHVIAALKDWKCWGYAFIYMGKTLSLRWNLRLMRCRNALSPLLILPLLTNHHQWYGLRRNKSAAALSATLRSGCGTNHIRWLGCRPHQVERLL